MSPVGEIFTSLLSFATILGDIAIVLFVVCYSFFRTPIQSLFLAIGKRGELLAGLFAGFSLLGAIVYSQVTGFPACPLCWIQRIAMGLLAAVLLYGIWAKRRIFAPAMLLAVVGGAVALYQYILQFAALHGVGLPCPADSTCDKMYILEHGYITIPMIALTAFVEIGILIFLARKYPPVS